MNYLGRDRSGCFAALRGYRRAVSRLRTLARSAEPAGGMLPAHGALAQLVFELEVDIGSRARAGRYVRMTPVEEVVFLPALQEVWATLKAPAVGMAPGSWVRPLSAALRALRGATVRLRDWDPSGRRRCDEDSNRDSSPVSRISGRAAIRPGARS